MKNRSGIWGSSCGFQSDKIQKPMVLVCAPVLPAPLPWFNNWRCWVGGLNEILRGDGERTVKAKGQNPPCPTGSPLLQAVM